MSVFCFYLIYSFIFRMKMNISKYSDLIWYHDVGIGDIRQEFSRNFDWEVKTFHTIRKELAHARVSL